jgi:anti-sigma factor RsiW
MNHMSSDELNELIDGMLPDSTKARVLGHIEECPSCSSAYRQSLIIDRGARAQIVERTGAAFVDTVMRKITPLMTQQSRFERIIKYSANFFALMILAFMIYGIIFLLNYFIPAVKNPLVGVGGLSNLSVVQNEISNGWNSLVTRTGRYLVTVLPQGKIPLWVYGFWSIIMVAIIEKIAGKRLRHRLQLR